MQVGLAAFKARHGSRCGQGDHSPVEDYEPQGRRKDAGWEKVIWTPRHVGLMSGAGIKASRLSVSMPIQTGPPGMLA
jgi:hypothetical protein